MKHSELISIITKRLGRQPTQTEIAKVLGKPSSTITSRAYRDLRYTYEEVKTLENHYKIRVSMAPVKNRTDIITTLNYIKQLIEDLEASI